MAEYNHNQASPSASWSISHNLGQDTVVNDVFVDVSGDLTKILPLSVEHFSDNILVVNFSSVQTGRCRIVTLD